MKGARTKKRFDRKGALNPGNPPVFNGRIDVEVLNDSRAGKEDEFLRPSRRGGRRQLLRTRRAHETNRGVWTRGEDLG